MAATILIVDDEPDIRELIGEILADEDYRPLLAANAEQARHLRETERPDLILLDVWMPDVDGISLLREWRGDARPDCPVVMISGHGSVEAAVEATRFGASDFIEKPVSMARLLDTIRKALATRRGAPGAAADADDSARAPDPVGRSEAIEALRNRLEAAAGTRRNVLISGPPGSGRSTLARWIHEHGDGAAWLELTAQPGRAFLEPALAHPPDARLDLVVDRIECLDADAEQGLLELIERSQRTLRVLSVAGGAPPDRLDTALTHRLAEVRLAIPALAERRADIPDLVRHLAETLPNRERLPYRAVPVPVQNRLRQHDWPGNLRELTNLMRELLMGGPEGPVELDEVESLLARTDGSEAEAIDAAHSPLYDLPLREAREAFERRYLIERLKRAGGSVGQLAEAVEMERTHLYRKLRQLGIDPKQVVEGD